VRGAGNNKESGMGSTALDRLSSVRNLTEIWNAYWPRARRSTPGVDGITPKQFNDNLTTHLAITRAKLRDGYTYSHLRGVSVPKKDPTKFRVICVPTIQDRVVQRAVLRVIETKALKLRIANDVSFGFVKDTIGTKRGTVAARAAAIKHRQARGWAFKADIEAFFDRISRDDLIKHFEKTFSLKSLLPLVRRAVHSEVDARDSRIKRVLDENEIHAGRGLRQGMPLSPILSNFVLRDFDAAFIRGKYDLVRYADDLVVFASSQSECEDIAAMTAVELEKLGLNLSSHKTEICDPEKPVEFLGMELGLKQGSSAYGLTISQKQIGKIKETFTSHHDVDFIVSKDLDLGKLLRKLDNMKSGYRVAYGLADNRDEFYQLLDQWTQNCVLKLYTSIFGGPAVERLTRNPKTFLMLV
jgi:RNA-directed DNA polymerase